MRFGSLEELKKYKRALADMKHDRTKICVCGGPACVAAGSFDVYRAMKELAEGACADVSICKCEADLTGCMGPCSRGPVVHVEPNGWFYYGVKKEDCPDILESVKNGSPCLRLVPKDEKGEPLASPVRRNINFLAKQKKLVMGRMDHIAPLDLDGYMRNGGFSALIKALEEMTPEAVCQEVVDAGLRGRGGGGFDAGRKWDAARKNHGDKKYVIVNGDEGDPGAYMDRCLMEGDPFSVLEGLMLGGYAIGSEDGIVYVCHEYRLAPGFPFARDIMESAVKVMQEAGLLGENILGTGFNFNVSVSQGGGAYICGESTALMISIEGKPAVPRVKYIRSAQKGLWESPTVLNNVETWACVPPIIENGAKWYRKIGAENNSGTKVFSLTGKVRHIGIVEVPMGVTLRDIIFGIGGGIAGGGKFKAVQTGGPLGGCLPADKLDTQVDFDSLKAAGSMMGSGGMIVMDEDTCMVDVARYFIDFLVQESCGKCVPCREGLIKMQTLLHDMTQGKARPGDTERLEELAEGIGSAALCGLGQGAGNPVLSTIKYFKDEYLAHERDHVCPAGICAGMAKGGSSK